MNEKLNDLLESLRDKAKEARSAYDVARDAYARGLSDAAEMLEIVLADALKSQ